MSMELEEREGIYGIRVRAGFHKHKNKENGLYKPESLGVRSKGKEKV